MMIPVRFEPSSSLVSQPDATMVSSILAYLSERPSATMTVDGYASSDGDLALNVALSAKRADAFKAYLIGRGVAAGRIVTAGEGRREPGGVERHGRRARDEPKG